MSDDMREQYVILAERVKELECKLGVAVDFIEKIACRYYDGNPKNLDAIVGDAIDILNAIAKDNKGVDDD